VRVRADEASVDAADVQFDVLSVDGEPVVSRPYSERRRILEELQLNDARWRTPQAFDDGEALWAAVCEHELEGVVAKRRSGRYVSGGRGWIKTKNRDYSISLSSYRAGKRSADKEDTSSSCRSGLSVAAPTSLGSVRVKRCRPTIRSG
jgi:ATP-dependent DNA ligase